MNPNALRVYSYLMREEIQFTRYCHGAYANREEWEGILKKSKHKVILPLVIPYVHPAFDHFALLLCAEKPAHPPAGGWTPIPSQTKMQDLTQLLHCSAHTISPLGLIFDSNKQCHLILDTSLYAFDVWCLSPCSDQSSVLMTADAFRKQFIPSLQPIAGQIESF